MTEKVLLGETLRGAKAELDLQELITGRTLGCCITRYGKSWTARRIVEQIFGKAGVIILDLEGEYSTLREKFPVVIIGKDCPLVPSAGEFLADLIVENNLSAIVDGSEVDVATYQEFVANFADRFVQIESAAKKPYLWIIEEADLLVPEKGVRSKSLCAEQITDVVKRGGKRGMGAMVLTQRPAFVAKYVISQCVNKIVGRTEWMADLKTLEDFAHIPDEYANPKSDDPHALKKLKRGEFYISGDFVERDGFVKVGTVMTTHLSETPKVVPPAPGELKKVLEELSAKWPTIIKEKVGPVMPDVKEIEAKIAARYEAKLAKKDNELQKVAGRTRDPLEREISDLKRKLEEASRHAAMAGPVTDILEHPLVKKNLEKLNPKQRGLVELLERRGPQEAKSLSLFIERPPDKVSQFVWEVNSKIKGLIAREGEKYVSKLIDLFPVTEEAKTQLREVEQLRDENQRLTNAYNENMRGFVQLKESYRQAIEESNEVIKRITKERDELQKRVVDMSRELNEYTVLKAELEAESQQKGINITPGIVKEPGIDKELERRVALGQPLGELPPAIPTEVPSAQQTYVGVDATLKRKLTSFEVQVSTEKFEANEESWEGKVLAIGLRGFFDEPQGTGKIMRELMRRYNVSDSGGTRDTLNDRLAMLVGKGILDRKQQERQWVYFASPEFKERVKKA